MKTTLIDSDPCRVVIAIPHNLDEGKLRREHTSVKPTHEEMNDNHQTEAGMASVTHYYILTALSSASSV